MATKYIFVTGGVVSGLGKGITAASLGRLLKARGYKVTMQKFDPYINVDPGTLSPYQHGEVFVTDDGAETDLDLGHYERFIDENLSINSKLFCLFCCSFKLFLSFFIHSFISFKYSDTSSSVATRFILSPFHAYFNTAQIFVN